MTLTRELNVQTNIVSTNTTSVMRIPTSPFIVYGEKNERKKSKVIKARYNDMF